MPHKVEIEHRMIAGAGVQLHVAAAGPENGPVIVFLHGFPEFWYGWRKQIAAFAQAGFRAIAVDQRGYNLSDKPPDIIDYRIDKLAADVEGVLNTIKWHNVVLVGHDWGGVVAWLVACRNRERINRLVTINAPHFATFRHHLYRRPAQMLKSWYIFYYQIPSLPERLLPLGNWRRMVNTMRRSSLRGTFSQEEFDVYREAWAQPGALPAMLSWYRAAIQQRPLVPDDVTVQVPTLVIWGVKDRFLTRPLAKASLEYAPHGEVVYVDDATHWVHHEKPDQVNSLIDRFVRG